MSARVPSASPWAVQAAQQRVGDLRTQLARAEEFATTLAQRLTSAPAP